MYPGMCSRWTGPVNTTCLPRTCSLTDRPARGHPRPRHDLYLVAELAERTYPLFDMDSLCISAPGAWVVDDSHGVVTLEGVSRVCQCFDETARCPGAEG